MTLLKKKSCICCHGKGWIMAADFELMRERRKNAGKSVRGIARELKLSAAYISDIELGRRNAPHRVLSFYDKL